MSRFRDSTGNLRSVVIPCHNGARSLDGAVKSVLSQSWQPLELIVVDDGSEDRSAEVARSFGGALTLLKQPHGGAGAARNAGIAEARGAFLAFLDADDLWPQGSLQARMDAFGTDPELHMVFGAVVEFRSPDLDPAAGAEIRDTPMAARLPGATVVRRELVERAGGFPTECAVGEGLGWMLRLQTLAVRSRNVDQVVLERRIHAGNLGRRASGRGDYLRVVKAALDRRRTATSQQPGPEQAE